MFSHLTANQSKVTRLHQNKHQYNGENSICQMALFGLCCV